ncbi:MAG TPA: GNAT family N-acetyltransferase [Thermoplasmata archaeon]|nr:GNAT family N-acetyltransferase [Thermoplasmata archaeon]
MVEDADAVRGGLRLLDAALDDLLPPVQRFDSGVTGLSEAAEEAFAGEAARRPGADLLRRLSMSVPIPSGAVGTEIAVPVPDLRPVRTDEVAIAELQALDARAFRGTVDESLLAESPTENARLLAQLMDGTLGRFLPTASRALLDPAGAPVAAILVAEPSAREAAFLDAVVDPSWRRRGLGSYLFRWSLRSLQSLGFATGHLWVTEGNAAARGLYDGLGFRPTGRSVIFRWRRPP